MQTIKTKNLKAISILLFIRYVGFVFIPVPLCIPVFGIIVINNNSLGEKPTGLFAVFIVLS